MMESKFNIQTNGVLSFNYFSVNWLNNQFVFTKVAVLQEILEYLTTFYYVYVHSRIRFVIDRRVSRTLLNI